MKQTCALLWGHRQAPQSAAHPGGLPVGGAAWAKSGIGVRSKEGTALPCTSLSQLTPPTQLPDGDSITLYVKKDLGDELGWEEGPS